VLFFPLSHSNILLLNLSIYPGQLWVSVSTANPPTASSLWRLRSCRRHFTPLTIQYIFLIAREKILERIKANKSCILIGETGSGKTTQIPQYIWEYCKGFGGSIAITQPRRLAAVTTATYVSPSAIFLNLPPQFYQFEYSCYCDISLSTLPVVLQRRWAPMSATSSVTLSVSMKRHQIVLESSS
jgi:hypothetical protein